MFLAVFLILLGVFFIIKKGVSKNKKEKTALSEGEVLQNRYIQNHEKKLKDDAEYEEYLEWCKMKGELAVDKDGFDEHRMKEFMMYKKLMKSGIGGL